MELQLCPGTCLLLVCLFLGCGGDDGISAYEQLQRSEQQAVEHIKQIGGEAVKKNYPLGEGYGVKLAGVTLTDETFTSLAALGRVPELDLSKSTITDAQMPRLAEIAGVTFKLDLSHTAISDAGLTPLADLVLLMDLNLTGTQVSAAAAAKFKSMRQANPKVMDIAKKNTKISL